MRNTIKTDYRYRTDWKLLASCWWGRLFILGLNIMLFSWLAYHIIDCVAGLSTGRYPIK